MLFDGIQLLDNTSVSNLSIESGSALPVSGNNLGELFYKTGTSEGLHVYDGSAWALIGTGGGGGGGSGVALDSANTWTAAQRGALSQILFSSTITPNFDASNNFVVAQLTGNITLANPTGTIVPGQSGVIIFQQDGTGSRTISWGTWWVAAGGTKPILSTVGNSIDVISYFVISPTKIMVSISQGIA